MHRRSTPAKGLSVICLVLLLASAGCGSGLSTETAASTAAATFSVTSYGAKGDGITDDGPAVQRAMNAAAVSAAKGSGGQVTFPCGEFSIQSVATASPSGRALLYLRGANGVQIIGQGSCSHVFTSLSEKTVFEFDSATQISVSQLRVTALNAKYVERYGAAGGAAIEFSAVTQGNINHVEVDGASAGALYLTNGTSGSIVANNNVHDVYGSGIWEDSCAGANAQNCDPETPPANNIYDSNMLTNTMLGGGGGTTALSLDNGGASTGTIIRNNTIAWNVPLLTTNNQVNCIQVNAASDVSVTNNSCSGTPWNGIGVTSPARVLIKNITIQGNTIQSSGTSSLGGNGIELYAAPLSLGISGAIVSYNTVSLSANSGIALWNSSAQGTISGVQVVSNTVSMADQLSPGSSFGIDVQNSASVTLSANTISCNGKCIAAGINIHALTGTPPLPAANQVMNILGTPLRIY